MPNPLRADPSRTTPIARRMRALLRRRWTELRRRLMSLITDEDALGLGRKQGGLTANVRWSMLSPDRQAEAFKEWLKQQSASLLHGDDMQEMWRRFTEEGFRKGVRRSYEDVTRAQSNYAGATGVKERMDFHAGSKDAFLRTSFGGPVSQRKIDVLTRRSLNDLEGVTDAVATKASRTLLEGLEAGSGPREMARDLADDLETSLARAETIARTEIVRAHAEGQLQSLEDLGVEDVGVAVEWDTTGDDGVCELCQPLQGVVLKLDEAKGLLPRHPNCRCAWLPANVGEDPKGQKRTEKTVKKAVATSERRGGKGDDWEAPEVEADRPKGVLNVDGGTTSDALILFSRLLRERGGKT